MEDAAMGREQELRLSRAVRVREWEDGNVVRRPETHFLDFVVGGVPLRDMVPEAQDRVTELSRPWIDDVPRAVDVLLGRRAHDQLDEGRVPLLVCLVCGNFDDGALTARLNVSEDVVTWSQWRWANFDGETAIDGLNEMRFDRAAYEKVLLAAPALVADFPYDEVAENGRRFLWPWQWGWRLPKERNRGA
jgi:hypothetical protein